MNWIAADLPALQLTAKQYFELGLEVGLAETTSVGRYFLGIVQYHHNEFAKAEASLAAVVSERRVPNLEYFTESAFALASVYQARGQGGKAREMVESVCEQLLRVRNTTLLQRAQAYQADLALRQGRMAEALSWAQGFDPEPFESQYRFFDPRLTLAKVLVARGSADSRRQADGLLTRMEAFFAKIHNTRFLIEVLCLQALLHDAQGDEPAAREVLGRALGLAQPGGFIRLFVDLGSGIARILNGLDLDVDGLHYVGRILAAFRGDGQPQTVETPDHNLSKRELEILALLAEELSNKQISDRLCISPATVKRHTENLYHKLGVRDRRKAVAKAMALAILSSS
jgi:LuxR family maltose regulon positive regulatory protein